MGDRFAPDAVIEGRYRVERLLGRGGMGEVWAAVLLQSGEDVALKVLIDADEGRGDQRRRFLREAKAATAVDHPNIVRVREVFETSEGTPVMVMDLLRGEPLDFRLAREGRLSVGDAAAILAPVVSATGTLHERGVIHRDLKPANIFLAEEGGHVTVKILDFGVAKLSAPEKVIGQSGTLTSTGALLGTPFYMAPEQCSGERDIDHRADIWALGIILYECLTGVRPTAAENLGQVIKKVLLEDIPAIATPGVPDEIREVVRRMLDRDRATRIGDLREVLDVLVRFAKPEVHVPSFGPPARVARDAALANARGSIPSGNSIPAAASPPETARAKRGLTAGVALAALIAGSIAAAALRGRDAKSPAGVERVTSVTATMTPTASAFESAAPPPPIAPPPPASVSATAHAAPPQVTQAPSAKRPPAPQPQPTVAPTAAPSEAPPKAPVPSDSTPRSPTPFVTKPPF